MGLTQDNIEKNTFDTKYEVSKQTLYLQSVNEQLAVIAERLNTVIALISASGNCRLRQSRREQRSRR